MYKAQFFIMCYNIARSLNASLFIVFEARHRMVHTSSFSQLVAPIHYFSGRFYIWNLVAESSPSPPLSCLIINSQSSQHCFMLYLLRVSVLLLLGTKVKNLRSSALLVLIFLIYTHT